MEDIGHEKILTHSIIVNDMSIIMCESAFFCIFFIMIIAALRISKPTAILIPLKALVITVIERKSVKNKEIK